MYLPKYALFMPGLYGALRTCFYFSKVKEEPLYTDMALVTALNAVAQYSPLLAYSMYKDLCVTEQHIRGLPQPRRVPIYFLVNDDWDHEK